MNLEWVFYFCELASVLQFISKVISWHRTRLLSRALFGAPAFLILLVAFALTQISYGEHPMVARSLLAVPLRAMFLSVGILWIFEGVLDIITQVWIPGGWSAVLHTLYDTPIRLIKAVLTRLRHL